MVVVSKKYKRRFNMLRVNIVGIGPGNPELLTNQARQAIEESNILIGDKRMLLLEQGSVFLTP